MKVEERKTKTPILQIVEATQVKSENLPESYNGESYVILKRWNNIVEAQRALNLSHSHINQSLKKGYRCNGFYWVYEEEWSKDWTPNPNIQKRNRPIYAYSMEGEFLGRFQNAIDAGHYFGVSISNIRLCAKENHPKKHHKKIVYTYTPKREEEAEAPFTQILFKY